jgi:hypothetical protein
MKIKQLRNYLIFGYIVLLVGGSLYVTNVLDHTELLETDNDKDKVEEINEVHAYLNIEGDKSYRVKLTTADTVNDLLEKLRDDKEIFFEKTRYIYGNELEELNKVKTPEGYKWKVFLNDTDVTYQMDKLRLKDETTYTLKLVKQ